MHFDYEQINNNTWIVKFFGERIGTITDRRPDLSSNDLIVEDRFLSVYEHGTFGTDRKPKKIGFMTLSGAKVFVRECHESEIQKAMGIRDIFVQKAREEYGLDKR